MSDWNTENKDLLTILQENPELNDIFLSREISVAKGEYIYLRDGQTDKVYFIIKGKVKIGAFIGDEKEVVYDILTEGDLFNESTLVDLKNKNEYAHAMENTKVASIAKDMMPSLLEKFPAFNIFMMEVFSEKVDEKQSRLESLVFKNSRTRIIEFLISCINKKGQRVGYEWVLRHFYTHQDIASLTSTSRQSVTTLLNELRKKNIIQFDRKRLLIRDMDQLKAQITA